MEQKVQIKIPKTDEKEVAIIPSGVIGVIRKKFEQIDHILLSVIIVLVLSMIAIIISVIGLFLDQIRYNNAAYREYSEKIGVLNSLRDSNNELLEQNKKNQEIIINQQKQILELLQKN